MEIEWHTRAKDDLDAIYNHIFKESPLAAKSVIDTISNLVQLQLPLFPNSGRLGRVRGTYELVVPKTMFIVVYRVQHGKIEIFAIRHTSQQWPKNF